jgi:aminoglycoside 6'-N-acetyltransferase
MDIIIGDKAYWNQGIGTQTIKLMTNFLFAERKADILFMAPPIWNKRTIYCYQKCGFKSLKRIKNMEQRDDKYEAGILMAKTKNSEVLPSFQENET